MGPHPNLTSEQTTLMERNREILAERLGWPEGAIEVCRHLEATYPGHTVWWGTGRVSDPQPGFYAMCDNESRCHPRFYGETAIDLDTVLAQHAPNHHTEWWR